MATLTVGTNQQYATLAAALNAARDGDTVAVMAGLYLNETATIRTKVTLIAVGGKVTLLSTQAMASGKALLTVTTDATVDGFVFAGARSADGTAAGLLDTGGALVVRNSLFVGNQNGLVVQASSAGTVLIQASEFTGNGANDGFSGNIGVGAIASLTIRDSYVHDANGGDEVKSLARTTTITGTRILDGGGTATSSLNLPKGGAVTIQGSTIQKGADATGPAIRLGGDTPYANTALTLTNSTLVADKPGAVLLQNTTGTSATITGNQVSGFGTIATGASVQFANTAPAIRPTLSTAALVVPTSVLPIEYGRAGAVVANGTVLTVGGAGTFATLGLALAAAHDGDTIRLAAGTYAETGLTISHRVIIEGVGGLARLVAAGAPANGLAEITTTTDVTLRNIDISGAAVLGGVAAGIRVQAGNLTLVNSIVHDNQAGIVADADTAITIGLYDTELARNGTADGVGANLDVADIGTLTLRNAWVHEAAGGAEIRSRAENTVIDATRVLQTRGSGAAIDLPDGGRVTIANSAIEKGANTQAGALVHVGGGTVRAGSSTTVSASTLISDVTGATTRFVVAEAGAGAVAVTGTGFEGGIAGSVQAVNATNTGALVHTGLSVNTVAPWGATAAPTAAAVTIATPAKAAAARGVLILRISGDAYRGNARFTLSVDGAKVGDTLTAAAIHGAGQSQSFTIAGNFAPGPHVVGVTLVNDLSSGTPGEDRNLYVDGMGFNGEDMQETAAITENGTALLATGPVTRSTAVTVNLSEDAWKGDAQAFITIDGKLQDGMTTVTAAHAAGKTQAMSFLLDLAPGGHTVGVTYLNDAQGTAPGENRNLYVDSVDIAGAHYAGAAATLATNGSSTFAFTVEPPAAANANLFLTVGLPQAASSLVPLG